VFKHVQYEFFIIQHWIVNQMLSLLKLVNLNRSKNIFKYE